MKNRDIFGWMVVGENWYTILVIGGLIVFVTGILHRIQDFWLIDRKKTEHHEFYSFSTCCLNHYTLFVIPKNYQKIKIQKAESHCSYFSTRKQLEHQKKTDYASSTINLKLVRL